MQGLFVTLLITEKHTGLVMLALGQLHEKCHIFPNRGPHTVQAGEHNQMDR